MAEVRQTKEHPVSALFIKPTRHAVDAILHELFQCLRTISRDVPYVALIHGQAAVFAKDIRFQLTANMPQEVCRKRCPPHVIADLTQEMLCFFRWKKESIVVPRNVTCICVVWESSRNFFTCIVCSKELLFQGMFQDSTLQSPPKKNLILIFD